MGKRKLTKSDIQVIKGSQLSNRELSKIFGISDTHIRRIKNNLVSCFKNIKPKKQHTPYPKQCVGCKRKLYKDNWYVYDNGCIHRKNNITLLKGRNNIYGYNVVHLSINNQKKLIPRHRIIAEVFLGKSNLTVDHIDGDKLNNHVSNLQYMTVRDNLLKHHRDTDYGYLKRGEQRKNTKLTPKQVQEIKQNNVNTISEMAKIYSISTASIYDIKNNRTWKHV